MALASCGLVPQWGRILRVSEHLFDTRLELAEREGLGQQARMRLLLGKAGRRLDQPRNEQHPHRWHERLHPLGDVVSRQAAGQDQVGYHKLQVLALFDQVQRIGRMSDFDYVETQLLQGFADQLPDRALVFDHQCTAAVVGAGRQGGVRDRCDTGRNGLKVDGQQQADCGAAAHHRLDHCSAARLASEVPDHRQPQTRARPQRLGGEERFEGPLGNAGRHPQTRIGDAHLNVFASA